MHSTAGTEAREPILGDRNLLQGLLLYASSCCSAGHLFDRVWVIAVGCILWAVMAASFCTTSSVSALSLSLWAVTGVGLALIVPNVQSTIAGQVPVRCCYGPQQTLEVACSFWVKHIRGGCER